MSNLVDGLIVYDYWTRSKSLSESQGVEIVDDISTDLHKLHNAMGLPNSATDALPRDMVITYCVGLICQYFVGLR